MEYCCCSSACFIGVNDGVCVSKSVSTSLSVVSLPYTLSVTMLGAAHVRRTRYVFVSLFRAGPKFIKRFKAPDYKDKHVFGVPLLVVLQRSGQPLPQCILYAMRSLRRTASDAVGIFRKSGVRSRIQKLRDQVEADAGMCAAVVRLCVRAYKDSAFSFLKNVSSRGAF